MKLNHCSNTLSNRRMKKIWYTLLPLVLISCSQNEVRDQELNYREGLFYEINSEKPFDGISLGLRNYDGPTTKTLIKNGIPVSGEQYYDSLQLRIAYEVLNTYSNRGFTKNFTGWQVKITECYHENGLPCSRGFMFYLPDGLPCCGSVSSQLEKNVDFAERMRKYYGIEIFEINAINQHRILREAEELSLYCANGLENYGPCADFGK